MPVGVHGIGHVNFRAPAAMIERLRCFYVEVVGLREGPRPRFRSGSHGYWLYAGDNDAVHLSISSDGEPATTHQSCFNHLAFVCSDLDATCARLDAANGPYETDVVDELGQVQLFLTDPAGVGVELTFSDETPRD